MDIQALKAATSLRWFTVILSIDNMEHALESRSI
jgi:hypothetical protein